MSEGPLTMVEINVTGLLSLRHKSTESIQPQSSHGALLVQACFLLGQYFLLHTTSIGLVFARGSLASTKIVDSSGWPPMAMTLRSPQRRRIFCLNRTRSLFLTEAVGILSRHTAYIVRISIMD